MYIKFKRLRCSYGRYILNQNISKNIMLRGGKSVSKKLFSKAKIIEDPDRETFLSPQPRSSGNDYIQVPQ